MSSAEYLPLFVAANRRAAAARERRLAARPLPIPATVPCAPTALPGALPGIRPLKSPKSKLSGATVVYLGETRPSTPAPLRNPTLEAALDRWKRAAEKAGVIKGEP